MVNTFPEAMSHWRANFWNLHCSNFSFSFPSLSSSPDSSSSTGSKQNSFIQMAPSILLSKHVRPGAENASRSIVIFGTPSPAPSCCIAATVPWKSVRTNERMEFTPMMEVTLRITFCGARAASSAS